MVHCGACGHLFLKNEGKHYYVNFQCIKCGGFNIRINDMPEKELIRPSKKYYCPVCGKYMMKGIIDTGVDIRCPHCDEDIILV